MICTSDKSRLKSQKKTVENVSERASVTNYTDLLDRSVCTPFENFRVIKCVCRIVHAFVGYDDTLLINYMQ